MKLILPNNELSIMMEGCPYDCILMLTILLFIIIVLACAFFANMVPQFCGSYENENT